MHESLQTMCPFCAAIAGLIAAAASSAGPLAALRIKKARKRSAADRFVPTKEEDMSATMMEKHQVVSPEEWLSARKELLAREKWLTRQYDEICAMRRALPWMKVEKDYVFDGPGGKETLLDLFDGRSQLVVRHFMFGPGWKEGCVGCSFASDHVGGALVHLEHHDVNYVAISRAPISEKSVVTVRRFCSTCSRMMSAGI